MIRRDPQKLLRYYRRLQGWAVVTGMLLFLLGGAYSIWAAQVLREPLKAQREAFDKPIARLAQIFKTYQSRISDELGPEPTEKELWLHQEIIRSNTVNMNLFLFILRIVPGMMLTTMGLLLFTVGLTARDLDFILKAEQKAQEA